MNKEKRKELYMENIIIAIDGPAGSGKGTLAKVLAEKFNLSHSTIGLYEQNRRQPEYAMLCKIADFFDIDLDYLLGRHPKSKKNNEFNSFKDALINLLESKIVRKQLHYDILKLSNAEIMDFIHDLELLLKLLSYKYKK